MTENYVEQCCDKATTFISKGDYVNAEKFLNKASSRDPGNSKVIYLLATIAQHNNQAGSASTTEEPGLRHRRASSTNQPAEPTNYSAEQKELADSINSKNDYYQILGVEKSATANDIKKAYRKLALRLHPDKNSAPGADEAFKRVSAAFSTLSDEQKRSDYDIRPANESSSSVFGGGESRPTYQPNNFNEFDAEDIFNMFFGVSPFMGTNRTVYRTRNGNFQAFYGGNPFMNMRQQAEQQQQPVGIWQRIAPILIIVIYIIISLFANRSSEPQYSLQKNRSYNVQRIQPDTNITYFVKPDFDSSRNNLFSVERDVLNQGYQFYSDKCWTDLRVQQNKNEKRDESTLPNCVQFRRYQTILNSKFGGIPRSYGNGFSYSF